MGELRRDIEESEKEQEMQINENGQLKRQLQESDIEQRTMLKNIECIVGEKKELNDEL